MLVVVSFVRRGCIKKFSSLGPLACSEYTLSGRPACRPSRLIIRLTSAQLGLAGAWAELGKNIIENKVPHLREGKEDFFFIFYSFLRKRKKTSIKLKNPPSMEKKKNILSSSFLTGRRRRKYH